MIKCTADELTKNSKPVEYRCINGKVHFLEGKALIASEKYKKQECKQPTEGNKYEVEKE
jgi:hypothetical protein